MHAAIIGGGFAGAAHASALKSLGIRLRAVVTSREETARAFAEEHGVPVWGTDPSYAFADEIDTVHICTPPGTHAGYVKAALLAGKNVFCEKPLSFDAREARELAELAEQNGRTCAVTYNVRYHQAVQRARELIRGGRFGRPLLIHGSYLQEFHVLPVKYDWRYDPEQSGGMRAVTEIGSHWIDTAQYISGRKVTSVSASFAAFWPERNLVNGIMEKAAPGDGAQKIHVDSEDAACITFRYEDGAMGSVMLSEISPGRGNRLALEITCEDGNLWWNEEENNVLHTAVRGEGIRSEIFAFGNGFNDTFVSLMKNFYEGRDYPTFREGAQIVEVCEAIRTSAENGSAWTEV